MAWRGCARSLLLEVAPELEAPKRFVELFWTAAQDCDCLGGEHRRRKTSFLICTSPLWRSAREIGRGSNYSFETGGLPSNETLVGRRHVFEADLAIDEPPEVSASSGSSAIASGSSSANALQPISVSSRSTTRIWIEIELRVEDADRGDGRAVRDARRAGSARPQRCRSPRWRNAAAWPARLAWLPLSSATGMAPVTSATRATRAALRSATRTGPHPGAVKGQAPPARRSARSRRPEPARPRPAAAD